MLQEKVFAEPRLIIFVSMAHPEAAQGFVIAEKEILLQINNFTVIRELIILIAIYYVFYVGYPKSIPARGFLLFIQEVLLEKKDKTVKRNAKYTGVRSIMCACMYIHN